MRKLKNEVQLVNPTSRRAVRGLILAAFAVCSIVWASSAEASSPTWSGADYGSPDRVLDAWADVTAGKGGVAPSIGLAYGRELGRLALYGKGSVIITDTAGLTVGGGLRYTVVDRLKIGCETTFGTTESHLWCRLQVADRIGVGLEKGLQGRYDAFSVTYSLTDAFDLSVYIGNNRTFWTRISVNLQTNHPARLEAP